MTEHAVVIAGGGPTGLMLAGELALGGGRRRHRRTTRQPGARRVASRRPATPARSRCSTSGASPTASSPRGRDQVQGFAYIPWTSATSRPATTTCSRCGRATSSASSPAGSTSSGCRSCVAARWSGFAQDDAGVDVELSDGSSLRAQYLVGCDGGRSTVRKAAGIEFAGLDPSISFMIAEVEMAEEPEVGIRREGRRHGPVDPQKGGPYRVVLKERRRRPRRRPDACDDLREALVAAYGTDYGVHSPTWISRFTDMTRQAAVLPRRTGAARRRRRPHPPPHGGQGLNTGVQDAVNLGWKLAQVVNGTSPDEPPRHLPRRTTPRRRPGAAEHHGASRAHHSRRPPRGAPRHHGRAAAPWTNRAGTSPRCSPVSTSTTTSAKDTRCSGGACPTSTCRPPTARPRVHAAARRPARAPQPRRARRLRHHAMGGPSPAGRRRSTSGRGSSRSSARSPRPRPCWSDPTGMSPGWETPTDPHLPTP